MLLKIRLVRAPAASISSIATLAHVSGFVVQLIFWIHPGWLGTVGVGSWDNKLFGVSLSVSVGFGVDVGSNQWMDRTKWELLSVQKK